MKHFSINKHNYKLNLENKTYCVSNRNKFKMPIEFMQYIRPLHTFNQIFGLSFNSYMEESKYFSNYLNYFIGLPFLCGYYYCTYNTATEYILKSNEEVKIAFIDASDMRIMAMLCFVDFTLTLFFNIFNRKNIQKSTLYIYQQMTMKQNFELKRQQLICKLFGLNAIVFGNAFFDWYLTGTRDMCNYVSVVVNVYLNLLSTLSYYTVLSEIVIEFGHINDQLLQVKDHTMDFLSINRDGKKPLSRNGLEKIIQLIERHRNLSEAAQSCCKTFSFKILLQIAFYFSFLVFGTSPGVTMVSNLRAKMEPIEFIDICSILNLFFWESIMIIPIYMTCRIWSSIHNEVSLSFLNK